MTKVFTIGFTKWDAADFFGTLSQSVVRRVIDVRLNNSSQLAGFSKKRDLEFFLKTICGIDYVHVPELAPTKKMLDEYKKNRCSWAAYEARFNDLLESRNIAQQVPKELFLAGCLLCSERAPHHCHRRLVAEYLSAKWDQRFEIVHL